MNWTSKIRRGLAAILAVAAAAILMSPSANAQTLRVATGSAAGTYSKMFKELYQTCGGDVAMVEVPSSGSQENITQLVGNQVNAAFVQSDVLYLRSRTEELGNVKTLVSLHPEQVHFVSKVGLKFGGTLGYGATPVTDITQLAGLKVGAAGGSSVTSQVIRLQSEIPYSTVIYDTNDLAIKALNDGKVDAVLLVGGAPLGAVSALTADYRLLTIPAATVERLKGVYKPARLNYPKMGAAGVTTVSTQALFVTREYKTQKMVESLARFRSCAYSKIDELKETTGTHPSWQFVEAGARSTWPMYELPSAKK